MLRRLCSLFLAVLLALLMCQNPEKASAAGYGVTVNGVAVQGTMAEMRGGHLMVAVRPLAEAMGGSVAWLQSSKRVTVYQGGSQLAVWVGSNQAFQDAKKVWAPVAPYIKQNQTMVPAWWLASRLGASVSFNGSTLRITTGKASTHPLMKSAYFFPLPSSASYEPYYDTMGEARTYGGDRTHEGTDILADKGTPIVAAASGTIERLGWLTLGGYRVKIRLDDYPEYSFYYAHMDRYASGLYVGKHVQAGQLLGYVGSTGYGPERTEGKFVPHLHFGIYGPNGTIDSFLFLKFWESHKVQW